MPRTGRFSGTVGQGAGRPLWLPLRRGARFAVGMWGVAFSRAAMRSPEGRARFVRDAVLVRASV